METKKCCTCKKFLPLSDFYKNGKTDNCCRTCSLTYMRTKKQYLKEYYQKHKEERLKYNKSRYLQNRKNLKEMRKRLRQRLFEMYGNVCACCGESILDFLTLEHKQGQRGVPRGIRSTEYRKATKEYRPDLYEILCYNCNCAKGKLGYCPHKHQ